MKILHEGCRAVSPNEHWFRGRYSPHTAERIPGAGGDEEHFLLGVVEETWDDWMENAMGQTVTPTSRERLQDFKIEATPFGVGFASETGAPDQWPVVARIDKKANDKKAKKVATLAPQFPKIEVGCTLTKVNGADAPDTLSLALPALTSLPLRVEFTAPVRATMDAANVPLWHAMARRAGLKAVGMVHLHERQQAQRNGGDLRVKLAEARAVVAELERQLELTEGEPPHGGVGWMEASGI